MAGSATEGATFRNRLEETFSPAEPDHLPHIKALSVVQGKSARDTTRSENAVRRACKLRVLLPPEYWSLPARRGKQWPHHKVDRCTAMLRGLSWPTLCCPSMFSRLLSGPRAPAMTHNYL